MHVCPQILNSNFFLSWSPVKLTTDTYSLPSGLLQTKCHQYPLFQGGQGTLDLEVMGQAPSLADFLNPLPGVVSPGWTLTFWS